MADEIRLTCKIDALLYDAFCTCDRELFTPKGFGTHAYKLDALPIQADQWISSPLSVAKMTMALECSNADSVLEIGCGSGYQAYILSRLIRRVFSIERIERLSLEAKGRFKTLGISNIHVRFDDGQNGWREFAPYDRILFSASIAEIPQTLFDQLQDGGILVAPIEKNGTQFITRYKKRGQNISCEELEKCLFVPIKDSKIY
ncbi:MAG: protein-L-isoaspartate(D-aspartate) O-methyltransferase [Sulfurospirillum sp.]|nr:protein-L-isoaspartate(D-aspartate) O-methyltransferase [Sulfurospirillum sp.]